jgi:hypothetical protein
MAQTSRRRGVAGLSPKKRRRIARAGGRTSHQSGHAHEPRAGEHAEQVLHTSRARDQDERDVDDNLDRTGSERPLRADARTNQDYADEVEPQRAPSGQNLDRRDESHTQRGEPDYGVNSRTESTGTAGEDR